LYQAPLIIVLGFGLDVWILRLYLRRKTSL